MSINIAYEYSEITNEYHDCFNSYHEFVHDFLESEEYYPEERYEEHVIITSIQIIFPENESNFQQFLPPLGTYFPDSKHISIVYTHNDTPPTLDLPKVPTSTVTFETRGITVSNIEDILHEYLREIDLVYGGYTQMPRFPPLWELHSLNMEHNQLCIIPDELPRFLTHLKLSHNCIQELPSSLPYELEELDVAYNGLRQLPQLPPTIRILNVKSNGIYELPSLPDSLVSLNCEDNCIVNFPNNLPDFLRYLFSQGNTGVVSYDTLYMLEYIRDYSV